MRTLTLIAALAGALAVSACNDRAKTEAPSPFELTDSAIGHYCGMVLVEHTGPKGQIILASRKEPIWFSSARDALSFTMLPEEPKDIRAIYVSDIGKAPSWEEPGATNWVEARRATFVVGSRMKGGMGAAEAVPFSLKADAERFASENGGRLAGFAEVPKDYVLGTGNESTSSISPEHGTAGQTHDHTHAATPSTHSH